MAAPMQQPGTAPARFCHPFSAGLAPAMAGAHSQPGSARAPVVATHDSLFSAGFDAAPGSRACVVQQAPAPSQTAAMQVGMLMASLLQSVICGCSFLHEASDEHETSNLSCTVPLHGADMHPAPMQAQVQSWLDQPDRPSSAADPQMLSRLQTIWQPQ